MSHLQSDGLTSASSSGVRSLMSNAHRRWTSLIAPPPALAKLESPSARSPLSKAGSPKHRRPLSLNLTTHFSALSPDVPGSILPPFTAARSRPRSHMMLSKINTSLNSPDRPSRRPHGPRSAMCSPAGSSAKSASRSHYHDIWKARAEPSTIRTSPPKISLP